MGAGRRVVLVVDAANVVGSRPDGWWRDRAGAASRLLVAVGRLPGRVVEGPDGLAARVVAVAVVLEGRARGAPGRDAAPAGVEVLLAPGSGDDALVDVVEELAGVLVDEDVVLVTADRGLRARVAVTCWGPGRLHALLDDDDEGRAGGAGGAAAARTGSVGE